MTFRKPWYVKLWILWRKFSLYAQLLALELGSFWVHTIQNAFGVKSKQYYWKDKLTGKMQGPFPSLHHALVDYKVFLNKEKNVNNSPIYVDFKNKKRTEYDH